MKTFKQAPLFRKFTAPVDDSFLSNPLLSYSLTTKQKIPLKYTRLGLS